MKAQTLDDAAKNIQLYLRRSDLRPYFVIAEDLSKFEQLKKILGKFDEIRISNFCRGDSPLDTDFLLESLNVSGKTALCYGLGEYIFFTAKEEILYTLQDRTFKRKIIFVARGIANLLEKLADEDSKFRTNRLCSIGGKLSFAVKKYSPNIAVTVDAKNFSELLKLAERGRNSFTVKTNLKLENVTEIGTYYAAVRDKNPRLTISQNALSAEQWQEYFTDENCEGYAPEHWRSFAAGFNAPISNPYLNYVFKISATYEQYQKNLLFALLTVDNPKTFAEFYPLRKAAVKNATKYLAEYLERLKNRADAVKFLTDNTTAERCAMIEAVQGSQVVPEVLKKNYPALGAYLRDYDFGDAALNEYFRRYKLIKLCNLDDQNFKNYVRESALIRPFNQFDTRQKILDNSPANSKLYWLDALGVEFLSFIKAQAAQLELATEIKIARAELPTLTSQNKNFYDTWHGEKFDKNQQLDDLKHTPENFSGNGKCTAPLYLAAELEIIAVALTEIKIWLRKNSTRKVILTSDHGASRLAVMYGREITYRNVAGEHGGRCCPAGSPCEKPPCAIAENNWWILANYDRFSGGRLATIEVHGGATLEEILVPVIEFEVK